MQKINKRKVLFVFLIVIAIIVFAMLICGAFIYKSFSSEVDLSLIKSGKTSVTRIFYYDFEDRENRVGVPVELKEEALFLHKSEWYSLYDLPPNLLNAFIAIEDKRFYEHNGVDWLRTARAAVNYLFKTDKTGFGGSTITQQLVKNLTGDNDVTIKRKFEEIFRAKNLEDRLSKNEILEMYLNVVYLSENCYGVASASEAYFDKSVKELTLAECASLAAIVKSPSKYDPYKHPENNLARRNLILKEMLSQEYITEAEYDRAINEELSINEGINDVTKSGVFSWYTETLINDVAKDISEQYDLSFNAAKMLIFKGGLNIYSVMDPRLQEIAEKTYESYKSYIPSQLGKYPESACVIIDSNTSDLLAIVGGTGKKTANMILNRAVDTKRAPGSVLKPLSVYAPAIEEGIISYATVFDDIPIETSEGAYWPKNSPNRYRGLMPASYALAHSVNTVAVKLLQSLSLQKSYEYLTSTFDLNIDSQDDMALAPLALGQLTNGESLINITNAYASFANGGNKSDVKTYLYVTDSEGNVILAKEDKSERALSSETCDIITLMLEGVIKEGTGRSVKLKENISVAGKTGTSGDSKDKWFIGYTPEYLCGVWTGFDIPQAITSARNPSCEIFNKIMNDIYKDVETDISFYISDNIIETEFCKDSGMLASDECRNDLRGDRTQKGYFIIGTEPKSECTMHERAYIDVVDGFLADDSTPNWRKRAVSLLNYQREKLKNIKILDEDCLYENRIRKQN